MTSNSLPSSVDVAIVGAGPAGSIAAIEAASRGVSTLILDRSIFPRYKTCGGGLIGPTLNSLPAGINIPVKQKVFGATFTNRGSAERSYQTDEAAFLLVDRADFDNELLKRAVAEGAMAKTGITVSAIKAGLGEIALTTSQGEVKARYVVGADGSASRIARYVGVSLNQVDLGLEVELDGSKIADKWLNRVHLDWGPIPGSYGWVFSKGQILTVGVIAQKGSPGATKAYLADFIRQRGLQGLKVMRDSGHLTRCRSVNSPLGKGNVLLCGDAAGLLEPWTREGISFAVRSGKIAGEIAAQAVLGEISSEINSALDEYTYRINSFLAPEMAAGARFLAAFERHPRIIHSMMAQTPLGWRAFMRITRGDTTFARVERHKSARAVIGLLGSDALRRTGL
jgi:geranylgeranyl reductase family protein